MSLERQLVPLDRHHQGRQVAKRMGWTVFQTNGETGEKEVVGGNRESALGLGNWGKAGEHNNGQREGSGVNARQASNALQHSCQENPMDRGARQASVYRVSKSWT